MRYASADCFGRSAVLGAAMLLMAMLCVSGQPVRSATAPTLKSQPAKPKSAADRPIKDKWALVIGISRFANPAINLKYPSKDASDFSQFLISKAHFAPDHVHLLTDEQASRGRILSELGDKWLPHVANPDDLVVIYFSSHGSPADSDVGGINYLVAHDTDIDSLYATGIPIQDLVRTIKARVHTDRVVIILDACHSGSASADAKGLTRTSNINATEIAQGTGQLVIASSKPDQVSWEGKTYQNSVFTKQLIDALQCKGEATTLGDAFEFMQERVQEEVLRERGVLQTPVLKSQWQGAALTLAVPPAKPRPGLATSTGSDVGVPAAGKLAPPLAPMVERPATLPKVVLNNSNGYAVENNPSRAATFSLDAPARLIYLFTYHWNYGRGKPAGTLRLQHADGTVYGPFQAAGKPGQGGVPDAYWECEPDVRLPAGTYTILDSDQLSWSQNAASSGAGFAKVKVIPLTTAAVPDSTRRSPVIALLNNGNVYAVFNKPSNKTLLNIPVPTLITQIMNYHWNQAHGQQPGQVALVHSDGTVYGPWSTHGLPGQGGMPNAYWMCEPNVVVKAGVYELADSDARTWAQNQQSGHCGITDVQGVPQE